MKWSESIYFPFPLAVQTKLDKQIKLWDKGRGDRTQWRWYLYELGARSSNKSPSSTSHSLPTPTNHSCPDNYSQSEHPILSCDQHWPIRAAGFDRRLISRNLGWGKKIMIFRQLDWTVNWDSRLLVAGSVSLNIFLYFLWESSWASVLLNKKHTGINWCCHGVLSFEGSPT